MHYPCPGNQIAKACAAYEDAKAVRTELFHQDVDFQIGIEKMHVATDPAKWVSNWAADPEAELVTVYQQIALFYNEPEMIGKIVKTLFENRLREVAESIVERQS